MDTRSGDRLSTPRPLAAFHRYRHGLPAEGYLLTEKVPGAVAIDVAIPTSGTGRERSRRVPEYDQRGFRRHQRGARPSLGRCTIGMFLIATSRPPIFSSRTARTPCSSIWLACEPRSAFRRNGRKNWPAERQFPQFAPRQSHGSAALPEGLSLCRVGTRRGLEKLVGYGMPGDGGQGGEKSTEKTHAGLIRANGEERGPSMTPQLGNWSE